MRYVGSLWEQIGGSPIGERDTWDGLLLSIHPEDLPGIRAAMDDYLAGRSDRRQVEFRMRTSAGEWRWIHAAGQAVERDSTGATLRLAGTVEDCTARRLAEEEKRGLERQLRQSQKMESVGTLAGGMAHDFNNVLLAIQGSVDLALAAIRENPSDAEDLLRDIRDAANRGASLTRRLLTFTQKHGGTQRRIGIDALVSDLLPMLRRLIPAHITLDASTRSGGIVLADTSQLEQVVVNLVVNARDAMRNGSGRIVIASSQVSLGSAALQMHPWVTPGEFVCLSVIDSGHGIAPEIVDRIFDPFFTTKPVGQGTGLGLSIVYAIAQQHGGFVTVQSPAGKGAQFDVLLPKVIDPQPGSSARPRSTRPSGGSEVVLLAEDDAAVRKMTIRILGKAGYQVVAAADGDEAIARFLEDPEAFQLALLDVIMPGKTGAEVFGVIRAARPDLKVLFTSGYSAGAVGQNLLTLPGVAQLTKPYQGSALLRQMRELLDQGS